MHNLSNQEKKQEIPGHSTDKNINAAGVEAKTTLPFVGKTYPGKVVLFKALRGDVIKNPTNGWDQIGIKDLTVSNLDCYHGSVLFEPAVSQIGLVVQKFLKDFSVSP